jgi:uncharacterized RDD family membrane protein YckC
VSDVVQKVGTPEGVAFELHPAGPVPRFLALLLDVLIGLFSFGLAVAALSAAGLTGIWLFLLLFFVIQTFGMVVFELFLQGASPGKRALGLQVVMADGRPVTAQASLIRNLLRFPDQLLGLGWFVPLLTTGFRRLGDLAAGTLVVYRPELYLRWRTDAQDLNVLPLPPHRPLVPEAVWAVAEFGHRWDEFGPGLRRELALEAGDLYRRDGGGAKPEEALRSVAAWTRGRR